MMKKTKGRLIISFIVLLTIMTTNAFISNEKQQIHKNDSDDQLTCVKHCETGEEHSINKYLKFELNKTYTYNVTIVNQIVARITNQTATNNETMVQNMITIDGLVRLKTLNPCEIQMQLDNVRIRLINSPSKHDNRDDDNDDNEELIRYREQFKTPIIFSYKDGIVTEVCFPSAQQEEIEDPFVINVKKSIISALQTRASILADDDQIIDDKVIETDYHGDCETKYHIEKLLNEKYSVQKQKDLLKCNNIEDSSEFAEIGYFIEESTQASSTCRQLINDHHVVESECNSQRSLNTLLERFDIDLIAKVFLVQKSVEEDNIQLWESTDDQKYSANIYGLRKSPHLHFEDVRGKLTDGQDLKQIMDELCQNIQKKSNRINLETPKVVASLSRALQYETYDSVKQVWQSLNQPDAQTCGAHTKKLKDIFVDTAASIMNKNTVGVVRDELLQLYQKQQERQDPFASERLRYLSLSLAFAQNPSREAVMNIVPELLEKIQDSKVVLSISALVKHVVENDGNQIDSKFKEHVYKLIMDQVLATIHNQTTEKQNCWIDIVHLLQSLSNIPARTPTQIQEQLLPVINGQENMVNDELIRSLAIKSLQSVQPTKTIRQQLLRLFSNTSETNEIRIMSYRTLINTGTSVDELQHILEVIQKEQSTSGNQDVYNYVCSHQKVLRTTKDVPKRETLPSNAPEFPEPEGFTQYLLSRHYEYASFYEQFGHVFELDVIMVNQTNNNGFNVPRSLTFNFTIQMESNQRQMPMAEVTVRQEGLEHSSLMEKLMRKFPDLFNGGNKKFTSDKLIKDLTRNIASITGTGKRLQVFINIDGKNVYVFDSQDQRNDFAEVWQRLHQKVPIDIDETMVIMPFQKRFLIKQTSSGVPMYYDINTTYIGSLEAMIRNQNQSNNNVRNDGNNLEIMLRPTIVAQTNIEFGSDISRDRPMSSHKIVVEQKRLIAKNQKSQQSFRLVNEILVAPTIHLQTQIQDSQVKLKFLLPEEEQTWWYSSTKIIRGDRSNSSVDMHTEDLHERYAIKEKCFETMMNYLGASVCHKTKTKSTRLDNDAEEIIVDYQEIVLRKQQPQLEGIEFTIELPQQILDPSSTTKNELKFGLIVRTPSTSNNTIRFQTEFIVHVPENDQDQLLIGFTIQLLNKRYQGKFSLTDNDQKIMKFELKSQQSNKQLLLINIDGKLKSDQEQTSRQTTNNQSYVMDLNFNINFQPFQGSQVFNGKAFLTYDKDVQKHEKNLQSRFILNGQQILDLALIEDDQNDDDAHQLSSKLSLDLLGLKFKNRMLFNLDQENVKLTSRSSYNRLDSGDKIETLDVDYQTSKHNGGSDNIQQRLFYYKMITSQYPQLNVELVYHDQQKPEEFVDTKFALKYGGNFERNQLKINQTTQIKQNVHSRENIQYKTRIDLEFKPRDLQYSFDSTMDLIKLEPKHRMVWTVQLQDVKRSQVLLKSNINSEHTTSGPFEIDTVGDVSLPRADMVLSFKHNLKKDEEPNTQDDVKHSNYLGKFEMVTISYWLPKWLPKQLQSKYLVQIDDHNRSNCNCLLRLLKDFRRFEHEVFYENEHLGHCSHSCLIEQNNQNDSNEFHYQSLLKRENEQVYDTDIRIKSIKHEDHKDLFATFLLDTVHWDNLKLSGEFQWDSPQHLSRKIVTMIKGENQFYQHKSSMNFKENDWELSTETVQRSNNEMVFKFLINVLSEKDSKESRIELQMPSMDVEHSSQIKMMDGPKPKRSMQLESQTRLKGRNMMKFNFKSQSNLNEFLGEFGGDIKGKIILKQDDDQLNHLDLDIQAPQKKIVHKMTAKWKKEKSLAFIQPWQSYRLLVLDLKNYYGDSMFYGKYLDLEDEPSQIYSKLLKASTHTSLVEMFWSKTQAKFIFKTKMFGGVDHQTEFTKISLPQELQFVSTTRQHSKHFLKLIGDIQIKNGKKSSLELEFDGNQLKIENIPSDRIQIEYKSTNGSKFLMEFIVHPDNHWSINAKRETHSNNNVSNDWNIKLDHKCDQFTTIDCHSKFIRGHLEHHMNKRSLLIHLKGLKNEKFDDFEHKTQVIWDGDDDKFSINSKTDKSGQKLLTIDADSDRKSSLRIKADGNVEYFPIMLATIIDLNDRHVGLAILDKKQNCRNVLEAQVKNWDDLLLQYAWGPKEDSTKKILLETKAKSNAKENRNEIQVRGQYLTHSVEAKMNKKRDQSGDQYEFQAKYDDLVSKDNKSIKLEHQFDAQGLYNTKIECANGQQKVLQGNGQLSIRNRESIDWKMETKTDLQGAWDSLNTKGMFKHRQIDNQRKDFHQQGYFKSGSNDKERSIELNGNSDSTSINFKIDLEIPNQPKKTFKLEWNKPEKRLQLNVYDDNGRIVDVNVDVLAKAVQKKFQIVSFIDQIPTIDIEAAFGENSHLVFDLSFQTEKKLQLSLNWFGQWRKDYQALALFKCWANPQFEIVIKSHHPATFDNIDAYLKYKKREIKVKLINEFNQNKNHDNNDDDHRWKREAIIEIDGKKSMHLSVDRSKKEDSSSKTIIYNGKLDGDYRCNGKAQVITSKQDSKIKMLRLEVDNEDQWDNHNDDISKDILSGVKHYLIEMLFRYQEGQESTKVSGLRIEKDHGEPLLIATYVEPSVINGSMKNTLLHLLLPGGVEYQMLNHITFEDSSLNNIRQIVSELKKRGLSQPLARGKLSHEQDPNDPQTNTLRLEIDAPNSYDPKPKVLKIRYSLESNQCHQQYIPEEGVERQKCSGLEIIFGDEQVHNHKPVSIKLEFGMKRIHDQSYNRSFLISMATLNESNLNRVLNFTVIGHLCTESIGYEWNNVNRYGNRNSGQFYIGAKSKPIETDSTKISKIANLDFIYRCYHGEGNEQQDSYYCVHLDRERIFTGSYVKTKWTIVKMIKKLLSLRIPRTEELSKRSDVCEWQNQMIRVLKEEIQFKLRLFKRQTINREMLIAISDEIIFARAQMKTTRDPLARKIINFVEWFADKFDSFIKRLDLEKTIEKLLNRLDKFWGNYRQKFIEAIENKCNEYEQCRRLYRNIRDYEIRQWARKSLSDSVKIFKPKHWPKPLENFLDDLNRQQASNGTTQAHQHGDQVDLLDHLKRSYDKFWERDFLLKVIVDSIAGDTTKETRKTIDTDQIWSETLKGTDENEGNKNYLSKLKQIR